MATGLTAFEKYTNSWRLDHPNFADVRKTTYAKGTITDFQKVSDDPLQVKSMVKVQIEGYGESDYIPLFFCPKKQYWDSSEGADDAQNLNQEGMYYENAWMSFRCDDEVKVLLQEGKPVAVVGFADGVPRRGEDIITLFSGLSWGGNAAALSAPPSQYRMQSGNGLCAPYENGINGLDNMPLFTISGKSVSGIVLYNSFQDHVEVGTPNVPGGYNDYYNWYFKDILVECGSIVYIFQIADNAFYRQHYSLEDVWLPTWVNFQYIAHGSLLSAAGSPSTAQYNTEVNREINILAAPSKKGLIDNIKSITPGSLPTLKTGLGGVKYFHLYPGFTAQSKLSADFQKTFVVYDSGTGYVWNYAYYEVGFSTFKAYQPPHTKAELQVAGMWPGA